MEGDLLIREVLQPGLWGGGFVPGSLDGGMAVYTSLGREEGTSVLGLPDVWSLMWRFMCLCSEGFMPRQSVYEGLRGAGWRSLSLRPAG